MTDVIANQTAEHEKETQHSSEAWSKQRKIAIVAAGAIAVAICIGYYLHSRSYESTDNAFLEGNVIQPKNGS